MSKGGGSKAGGSTAAVEEPEEGEGGEGEEDPLQMMLDTKKKRVQTDEEMRVRVDEEREP